MRRGSRLSAVALVVVALGGVAVEVPPVSGSSVIASDSYSRQLSGGWGTAPTGGTYRLLGTGPFSVNGSAGVLTVAQAYQSRAAVLADARSRDVDMQATFRVNRLPTSGRLRVSLLARVVDDRSHYRVQLTVRPTGAVVIALLRNVDGVSHRLGDAVALSGVRVSSGSRYRVRLYISGATPTTLRAKVWSTAAAQPSSWSIQRSDGTTRLQQAGGLGLAAATTSRFSPLPATVQYDDLIATGASAGSSVEPPATAGQLLMSRTQLASLPLRGSAWDFIASTAKESWSAPNTSDKDSAGSRPAQQALAGAIYYARTGEAAMRAKVIRQIERLYLETPWYSDALALYRQIPGWVLASDLVGYRDSRWLTWLDRARTRNVTSHSRWYSITVTHEDSPNNWGAFAGAARIAISAFLGDRTDLDRAWRVYRGFLGERSAWSNFQGQSKSMEPLDAVWACNAAPSGFVPVNPPCSRSGINLNGAIVRDASRDDRGLILPMSTGLSYTLESLQGLVLQAELLSRSGYPNAWQAGDNALKRIGDFVSRNGAAGGLTWNHSSVKNHVPWLMNARLGTSYPTVAARYGRAFGYTDWLYGGR